MLLKITYIKLRLPMSFNEYSEKPAGPPTVINAGCWRTGTASMAAAYRALGLRSHHTLTDMGDLQQWAVLEEAAEAKWPSISTTSPPRPPFTRADWDRVFGTYDAVTDGGADHVEELAAAYPDAKVVVVERPGGFERWWPSFEAELVNRLLTPGPVVANAIIAPLTGFRGGSCCQKTILGAFGARDVGEVRAKAREYYEGYYEHVRRVIPAHRRLDYRLGSGWAPLCEFLEKDVPQVDFPRVNESEEHSKNADAFTRELALRAWRTVQPYFVSAGVLAVVAIAVYIRRI